MTVFLIIASAAVQIFNMVSEAVEDETSRIVISAIIIGISVLGYKIPGFGYGFKTVTSALATYLGMNLIKYILPELFVILTEQIGQSRYILIEIIVYVAVIAILARKQIKLTEYTFLHTEPVEIIDIKIWLLDVENFLLLKRYKFKTWRNAKSQKKQKELEVEQMEKNAQELFRKLEDEKRFFAKQQAQLERDRIKFQEEYEQFSKEKAEQVKNNSRQQKWGFFDGCKNEDEIKICYRKLVQEFHPDGTRGNAEMFKKIQAEYESLIQKIDKNSKNYYRED